MKLIKSKKHVGMGYVEFVAYNKYYYRLGIFRATSNRDIHIGNLAIL